MTSEEKILNLEKERDFYKLQLDKISELLNEYYKLPYGSEERMRLLGKIDFLSFQSYEVALYEEVSGCN